MKKMLLIFAILISFQIEAQEDKTVTLTVSGTGKTLEEAKTKALRSAIEQAFGAFISSKTEILNDQLVADQISSVSSGNIQSFEISYEAQFPNGSWGVTLKTIVSVSKLQSFVQSKGIEIEIKGGLFAMNIKQQLLNEQGEIQAVSEMVGLLHEPMQNAYDYIIKSGEPKSLDAESKNWEISLEVTTITNKNIDFCANYCIKTLSAVSLSAEEVINYKNLNKAVFPITIDYNGTNNIFYLRKQTSINALNTLLKQSKFYTRLFTVQSGIDESNGKEEDRIKAKFSYDINKNNNNITINFLTTGQQAATFSWKDKLTLSQIEKMTGYKVKPRGVVSKFKHGGIVIYEKNGHGLVVAITDLGSTMDWNSAKTSCDELILNGYNDWHLPSKEELNKLYLLELGVGGFERDPRKGSYYWSSTETTDNNAWIQNFDYGNTFDTKKIRDEFRVRAVRNF